MDEGRVGKSGRKRRREWTEKEERVDGKEGEGGRKRRWWKEEEMVDGKGRQDMKKR